MMVLYTCTPCYAESMQKNEDTHSDRRCYSFSCTGNIVCICTLFAQYVCPCVLLTLGYFSFLWMSCNLFAILAFEETTSKG